MQANLDRRGGWGHSQRVLLAPRRRVTRDAASRWSKRTREGWERWQLQCWAAQGRQGSLTRTGSELEDKSISIITSTCRTIRAARRRQTSRCRLGGRHGSSRGVKGDTGTCNSSYAVWVRSLPVCCSSPLQRKPGEVRSGPIWVETRYRAGHHRLPLGRCRTGSARGTKSAGAAIGHLETAARNAAATARWTGPRSAPQRTRSRRSVSNPWLLALALPQCARQGYGSPRQAHSGGISWVSSSAPMARTGHMLSGLGSRGSSTSSYTTTTPRPREQAIHVLETSIVTVTQAEGAP